MKCCFPSSSENRTKTLHCSSSVLPEQPSPPSSSPSPPPPQTHPHARHHRAEHHQTTLFLHEVLAASCIPPFASPPLSAAHGPTAETRTSAPRASSPPSPTLTPTAWPIATLIDRNSFHHYHNSSARRAPFTLLFGLDVIGAGKKFLSPSCF